MGRVVGRKLTLLRERMGGVGVEDAWKRWEVVAIVADVDLDVHGNTAVVGSCSCRCYWYGCWSYCRCCCSYCRQASGFLCCGLGNTAGVAGVFAGLVEVGAGDGVG